MFMKRYREENGKRRKWENICKYVSNKKITIPNISRTQMKQIKKDKQHNRIF